MNTLRLDFINDTPGAGESVTFTESDSDELCARESKEWRGK